MSIDKRTCRIAPYECDLHTHTVKSDGNDTYDQLICNAVGLGIKVLAITDHDVIPLKMIEDTGGAVTLQDYGKRRGIRIIPGIEWSCNTDVEDVHILGLNCDFSNPAYLRQEKEVAESKIESYRALCRKLSENHMPVEWEEVLYNNGVPIKEEEVQKKQIFELLTKKGFAADWSQAKMMVKHSPELNVKRRKPEAKDMIQLIKDSGGIAIQAHPYLLEEPVRYNGRNVTRNYYIKELIEAGLDGIEGAYAYDKTSYKGNLTPSEIEIEVRKEYGPLVQFISGGSDYHNDGVRGVRHARQLGEKGVSVSDLKNTSLFDFLWE